MQSVWSSIAKFASVAVFLALFSGCSESEPRDELVMFCAAGMKAPVSRIAEQYEKEKGVTIQLQFAGSGTLLSNLQVAPGDIYLAADSSYMDEARKRELITETFAVAEMKAGLGVPEGNPKQLRSLSDIRKADVRVAIGNPEAASIGRFTKKIMTQHGAWKGFEPTALFPTVNELANAIKLNTVDAVILWDAIAHQYSEIDFVALPEFDAEIKDVTIAVTKSAKKADLAREFCLYLSASDKGGVIFEEEGYTISSNKQNGQSE